MLTIEDLSLSYNTRPVLKGLNLQLSEGYVHGLIGLNGAGKTSLFNCICGFSKASQGRILWRGKALSRKDIALLECQNYFYSNITGNEYLRLFSPAGQAFQLQVWQTLFKLPLDELIETYSTGMKKKLALLGVIKLDREIYLLDEPFNGVDLETAVAIKVLLAKLKERGKTILLTSHIMETIHGLCDIVHHLEEGSIKRSYQGAELEQLHTDILQGIEREAAEIIEQAFSAAK